MKRNALPARVGGWLGWAAAASLLLTAGLPAADHRDGPIFGPPGLNNPSADLNDLFIFQSPANAANTVLIMTVAPFAGQTAPATFDPALRYEIAIDQDRDFTADLTFRATFAAPGASGDQVVMLTSFGPDRPTTTLASGNINSNIPLAGDGMFRAGLQDDPFFFDMNGFSQLVDDGMGTFPRAKRAMNFFGPNVNTLAVIIEIPTAALLKSADRPILGAWMRTLDASDAQLDRAAQPTINQTLIPPVPRNDTTHPDRRDAFNRAHPEADLGEFRSDVVATLTGFWKNTPGRAGAIVDRLILPNVLTFDTSFTFDLPTRGYPNGRRLRDDVADFILNLLTRGEIPTDNVADDNGDRITDGTMRADGSVRPATFPYIGPPNP